MMEAVIHNLWGQFSLKNINSWHNVISCWRWFLQTKTKHGQFWCKGKANVHQRLPLHTVGFDWFLSGSEWILNLQSCILKLLIYYQKSLWNIKFSTCLIKIFIFCAQSFNFDQTYLNSGLKTQNVEELGLDLIFYNNLW